MNKSALAPVQMFSGPDSTRAAEALRIATVNRRDQWPYPHVYPPPESDDVFVIQTSAAGAAGIDVGSSGTVLTYRVNSGKRLYLLGVIFGYQGGSFVPGDATFTLNRNSPTAVTDKQAMPEHGLVNVPVLLGGELNGSYVEPFLVRRAREFAPLSVLRIVASNVTLTGGTFVAGVFGYEIPDVNVRGRK